MAAGESPTRDCDYCGRSFVLAAGPGRPRRYCRRSCRQRAFERRRHASELGWSDGRLVEMARELARHEDRLDEVASILDELRRDAADGVAPDAARLVRDLGRVLR